MEAEVVDVGGMGGAVGTGGIVAAIHKAAQEVLGQLAGTPSGAPAALDAVEGQRHAHDARHEETDGGEGQPDAQGVGGLIGGLPDGGVGLRLAGALREARAEEVAVDGFKRAPEQILPQHENALADERLHREGHTKHERDPQGATHHNLAAGGLLGLEQTDAYEAEREQVEGDHTENVRRNVLPAGGGGHPDQIKVDQHEPNEATDKGGRKQQLLEQRHFGTD